MNAVMMGRVYDAEIGRGFECKAVLAHLAALTGQDGVAVDPVATIADSLEMDEADVVRALEILQGDGLVRCVAWFVDGDKLAERGQR